MSSELLDKMHAFLGRFIAYPSEETHVAHTLWIVHTHLMDEWRITPRLAVLSPELESGKTRALEITKLLVPRPVKTENATAAYIFRKVSDPAGLPTILFDEIDTVFGPNAKKDTEELRGLFNAGYQRGGVVGRCAPNTFETQEFPAYCALAFAGIDNLRGIETVLSRSVIIKMRRRKPNEHVEQYRERLVDPEGHKLRDELAKWAWSLKGKIGQHWPEMPEGVNDRSADVWEPLLAIADIAGGDWREKARVTAVTLVTGSRRDTGESYNIRLLSDLRELFGDTDKLFTSYILYNLVAKAPWNTIKQGGMDALLLAKFLSKHNIAPKLIRIKEETGRGYERADFVDAWDAYLPPLSIPGKPLHPLQVLQTPDPVSTPTAVNDNSEDLQARMEQGRARRQAFLDETEKRQAAEREALNKRLGVPF